MPTNNEGAIVGIGALTSTARVGNTVCASSGLPRVVVWCSSVFRFPASYRNAAESS